jgi:hypothetical protein
MMTNDELQLQRTVAGASKVSSFRRWARNARHESFHMNPTRRCPDGAKNAGGNGETDANLEDRKGSVDEEQRDSYAGGSIPLSSNTVIAAHSQWIRVNAILTLPLAIRCHSQKPNSGYREYFGASQPVGG